VRGSPDSRGGGPPPPPAPPPPPPPPPTLRPFPGLEGFGNNAADYVCPFGSHEEGLATQLRGRGWHVEVLDLERKDWLRVARSLMTLGIWSGTLTTDPGYSW
jgi:hypothetical protein